MIFASSFKMTLLALQYGSRSNSLMETPLFLVYAIVPAGMILLLIQTVIDIVKSFKGLPEAVSGKDYNS